MKNVGYRDDQIEAIQNYDGSTAAKTKAASDCSVWGTIYEKEHSASGSKVRFRMRFHWDGIQSNWWKDIFAVTWSSPFKPSKTTGSTTYAYKNGKTVKVMQTVDDSSLYGVSMKFKKYYQKSSGAEAAYLQRGKITLTLTANTNVKDFSALAKYGYNTISVTPSVSFAQVPLGISFSTKVVVKDTGRVQY